MNVSFRQVCGRVGAAVLLSVAIGAAACSQPAAPAAPPPRPPNIVFVLVDDMRWDEIRAAGHPFIETPNMDRLAREGARFTNARAVVQRHVGQLNMAKTEAEVRALLGESAAAPAAAPAPGKFVSRH